MPINNPSVPGVIWEFILKPGDEIVNNSNVLQDDNDLLFVMGANEVYAVKLQIEFSAAIAADFRCHFALPAGGLVRISRFSHINIAAAQATAVQAGFALTSCGGSGVAVPQALYIELTAVNGATPGNFQFRWAQNTADVSDCTVLENSFIARRLLS